uniref:Chromosome 19 open reading frame 44 n=1 Tax=Lepisosteus oculatus TaxID=7918 RepID=W5M7M6_LEPOC
MWKRSDTRSSALARAQAQLSGQRVYSAPRDTKDELQVFTFFSHEYMDTLMKKTSSLKEQHTLFQDLSDVSIDDAESETKENAVGAQRQAAELERPSGASRFLKKAPQSVRSSQSPTPSKASTQAKWHERGGAGSSQSAALNRLALIESRIRNRKLARDRPDSDKDVLTSEEKPLSGQSSSELSARGSRFLKKKAPLSDSANQRSIPGPPALRRVGRSVSLDSDEEDMKKLLGGSPEAPKAKITKDSWLSSQESPPSSFLKSNRPVLPLSPSSPGRKTLFAGLSRSPSPPSRGSPRPAGFRAQLRSPSRSLSRSSMGVVSGAPSPSPPSGPSPRRAGSPRSGFPRRSLSSLSARSDVRSLDELFPDASESDDAISEKSKESDDFRINILTLDDLVPATLGEPEKPEEKKENKTGRRKTKDKKTEFSQVETPPTEVNAEYESDFESEIRTETEKSISEISERLGDVSVASEVQEDWTRGSGSPSETDTRMEQSFSSSFSSPAPQSEVDRKKADLSCRQGVYSRSSASSPSASGSGTLTPPHETQSPHQRKAVKDTAVQTQFDGLSYSWSNGMAVLGPSIGTSHLDPTPVASHVVSADAIEALTAYSPAVFALNDMLKQQLALTRQFIDNTRHLHTSLLQSLGPARYRYTTLEDTKEFIQSHKSPPLTVEQALEEVLQEMREYHYL